MSDDSLFLCPLTNLENFLYDTNKNHGCMFISYVLRISSSKVLTEGNVREVFKSLYRKTPNLRLCVDEKNGELWMKQMKEENIDFKILENADVNKTYHDITDDYPFDYVNGPLWCARLLPFSPDQSSFVNDTTCVGGELAKFQNVCHIVVLFSHTITDGYSCIRIMKSLLSLLNAKISGENVDESEQIGTLLDLKHETEKKHEIEKAFLADPDLLERRMKSFGSFALETLFEKAYPATPFLKPKTLCHVHVVDEITTQKFVSRCKKEGVTVHTGFCTLAEATAVKMLLAKGYDQEIYKISSLHAADSRVYYKNCNDEFGAGIGVCDFTHHVSKQEIMTDFWNAARKYHAKFKEQHKQMPGLEHDVFEKLAKFNPLETLPKEGQASPSKNMCYYCTTNMRDITVFLGNRGDHVQLEFMDRLSTMHLFPCIWMNTFNTFRGKFIHSLQYNSHVMETDVAKKYSDTLFQLFSEVCE